MFVHTQSDTEASLFEEQVPTIITLTKGCKSVKIVRDLDEIPAGCGSTVLTPTVAVHVLVRVRNQLLIHRLSIDYLYVQGLVDLDVEIAKCDKKLDLARLNLGKITKIEAQPEYEETIPANVRLMNEEKVSKHLPR